MRASLYCNNRDGRRIFNRLAAFIGRQENVLMFRCLILMVVTFAGTVACTPPTDIKGSPQTNIGQIEDSSYRVILVSYNEGKVGGIDLRPDGKVLVVALGSNRVRKSTEELEGDPNDVYIIRFGNHEVYRHWNAFSFKDPIFKTDTGLGIGSSIAAFEKIYGEGKFVESEIGSTIDFHTVGSNHFAVRCDCSAGAAKANQAALARDIWVW